MSNLIALAERLEQTRMDVLSMDCAAALRSAQAEIERRHGIGGELIIARRERDEWKQSADSLNADVTVLGQEVERLRQQLGQPLETERENERLRALLKEALRYVNFCHFTEPEAPALYARINAALGDKHD